MTCDEAEILLHALIDGELDAGHAREVEDHIAGCPHCTALLADYREMSKAVAGANLQYRAPLELRRRIEASLPQARPSPSRRSVLRGFAMGSAVSAIAATGLVAIVLRNDDEQRILSEVVSAHLRSLQAGHLTDVISTDQHTVKPWFNGKLDVSPPVVDLTAQGFTLIGGRLDYVDARAIGAVVYRRRQHIINLFVAQTANTERRPAKMETMQGFNVRRWSEQGMNFWAVSDIAPDELAEFGEKFEAALGTSGGQARSRRLSRREFVAERAACGALHQGLIAIKADLAAGRRSDIEIGGAHQQRAEFGFVQRAEELGETATRNVDMQRLAVAPQHLEVDLLLGDVIETALQDGPFASSAAFDALGYLGKQQARPGLQRVHDHSIGLGSAELRPHRAQHRHQHLGLNAGLLQHGDSRVHQIVVEHVHECLLLNRASVRQPTPWD